MARSPYTEIVKRVEGMVSYVQQNLSGDEYNLFLDMVAPQPEPEPAAKKTRKKRTTKSAKAQSLSSAIKSAHEAKAEADSNGGADESPAPNCGICGQPANHSDHDRTYLSSHDFEAPKSVASAAKKSKRKEAHTLSVQNSEIEKGAAISAGS